MVRPDHPPSRHASESVNFIVAIAIIDFILLIIATLWVVFVCNGGMFDFNTAWQLTAMHYAHLLIIFAACLVFPLDRLYVPFFFGVLALGIFIVDIFVIITRGSVLLGGGVDFLCELFLFIFDLVFLLIAVFYLGAVGRTTAYHGMWGDGDDPSDPLMAPLKGEFTGPAGPHSRTPLSMEEGGTGGVVFSREEAARLRRFYARTKAANADAIGAALEEQPDAVKNNTESPFDFT